MKEENIVLETKLSGIDDGHSSLHTLSNPINDTADSETEVNTSISTENTNPSEKTLVPCNPQEQCRYGDGDICTRVHSEEQSSCSFSHLYKNFGNVNFLRGNFRLRQTRSLYENKRRGTECLRVCKSAVINLGSLKIDIEMIKFLPGGPKVGDFDDNLTEEKEKRDSKESRGPVLEIEHSKEPDLPEKDETNPSECKIGFNCPNDSEIIPEKIYQCYVCNCPKRQEQQYESDAIRPPAVENLEERIDRLLQINPFAPPQDTDHQCDECSDHKIESNSPSNIPPGEGCKYIKNSGEKSNLVHQEQHRYKCTLKSQETSLGNELELSKQGDTLCHDENCTCVDCLCNPSKFKNPNSGFQCESKDCKSDTSYDTAKNSLNDTSMFRFEKPPEITVMNVVIPCDCGNTCTCDPCFDPNRAASQAQSKQEVEKKCVNNVPKARPSLTREPSLDDPFNNRDTWKNVVGCYCPPSSSKKKEVCDCKECECKPCGYKDKVRKPCDCKKPKEQPKPPEPAKKKGKCSTISCVGSRQVISVIGDTVSESKNRASLPIIKSPLLKKNCNCEICECVFCSESETQSFPERIKEECSVYEKPCEKKYVSLLSVEPCDRSKCDCGNKRPPRTETINYSRQPEKVDEVVVEKKESLTESGVSIPKTEEVVLDEAPTTQETPTVEEKQSESEYDEKHDDEKHEDDKQEDDKVEEKPEMSELCNCSECFCDPCKTTEETPQLDDHEDEPNIEDVPPEAFDKKSVTPLASEVKQVPSDKPASVIDQAQGDKTEKPTCFCNPPKPEEQADLKSPCDCSKPCPCAPCPDPNVINEIPPIIGDADIAKNEIRSVLEKISCTCNKAENDLKPLLKQASTFESTVSKMKLKLNNLEQKCKDKDQIINAMTKDLRMRSQSGVFANLLNDLAHPKERFVPDFNRTYVCDFLPKPRAPPGTKLQPKRSSTCRSDSRLEPILELDRYLPGGNEDIGRYRRNLDASGLEIIDIRRVTLDSVLIKWRSPCNLSGITGYQIFVNDELKYKVLSPNRTSAVLDTLELSRSIEIMLFAMSTSGRCEPPALATYKI
ncbi:hypothetical protein WA026_013634 [Henosepilachna vigintioctopunctata]|uniref:Fibronectin type-III domain-containing protein n=1 Tax=Henosepilachna vigintioctopunctata TaxID=420089 RepID=A0AAW1UXG7_9CUCU